MQTFLPLDTVVESVEVLDDKRLGKQRVEAMQILKALRTGKGWIHHPITKMWKGYETALAYYMNCCIHEWIKRGFKNTMEFEELEFPFVWPSWFGDKDFHASHRANLLRKDYEYYSKYGWKENPEDGYVWIVDNVKYEQVAGTGIKKIITENYE